MLKRSISLGISLVAILVFAATTWSASTIGDIAIFTEAVSWTDVGTANAAAQMIIDELKLTKNIEIMNDKAIGEFAKEKTDNDKLDIIITFGYFPVSLYKPGNGEANNSVGEKFLEAGNMFINTADYIFYVTQGGGANGDTGLKNMTDSTFDMWTDGNRCKPAADGKKYTPSLPGDFDAPRCFKTEQVESDKDWEVEVILGESGTNADPTVIRNKSYGGRVGIAFQAGGALPRGEVIIEMIDNWLSEKVKPESIEPAGKLPITWSEIKQNF